MPPYLNSNFIHRDYNSEVDDEKILFFATEDDDEEETNELEDVVNLNTMNYSIFSHFHGVYQLCIPDYILR